MGSSPYTYCHRHRKSSHEATLRETVQAGAPFVFLPAQPSHLHCSLLKLNDSKWVLEDKNEKVALSTTVLSTNETFSSIFGTYMFNFAIRTCKYLMRKAWVFITGSRKNPLSWAQWWEWVRGAVQTLQACHTGYPPRVSFKMKIRGYRHGSEVKSACYSFRDWSLVPTTYIRWLKTACNPNFRDFNTFFWVLLACAHKHKHADTYKSQ